MKQRIARALAERGRTAEARDVEFAPISTIHAFLARVLRERALDAGLDPRFVVADEMTAQLHLEAALERAVDGLDGPSREALSRVSGAEEAVLELFLALRATPLSVEDLRWVRADREELGRRMTRFLEDCAAVTQGRSGRTADKLAGLARGAVGFAALDPDRAEEFADLVGGHVTAPCVELFREGKALRDPYRSLGLEPLAEEVGAAVREALAALDRFYAEAKRAEGLVDFADLERIGLAVLHSPAGTDVAAGFDHLLVDEYQDTSRIQEAVLDRLAAGCQRFGVGDEKQSIYRFRYADVGVFRTLQERASRFRLTGSFRTRPEIVDFVNRTFARRFAGTGVAPQDLRALAGFAPADDPRVEVVAAQGATLAVARRAEARALARRLRQLAGDGATPLTREGREGPVEYRHCALLLRTMTHLPLYERALADEGVPYVVVKGRGYYQAREVVDLAHLLLLLGDPLDEYRATAAMTSLFCGATDGDVVQVRALADADAGTGDDADADANAAGDGHGLRFVPWPLRPLHAARPEAVPPERWRRFVVFAQRFRRWRRLLGRLETGDLVETILHETRFAELSLVEPDGRRRHANLQKALHRARDFPDDPVAYARSLLEFRDREMRESEAPVASEADQAVRIMTVHAAKGLEWPVVAVGDLGAAAHARGRPILRPDGLFGVRIRAADEETAKPPGFEELTEWDKEQEGEEQLRLLYVAYTRAEERLLLAGAIPDKGGSKNAPIRDVVDAAGDGVALLDARALAARGPRDRRGARIRAAVRRRAPLAEDIARDDRAAAELLARLDALDSPVPDNTPYVAAVADLVEHARCPRRYRLKRMYGLEWDEPAGTGPAEDPEAEEAPDAEELPRRELGTVFHEVMEEVGPWTVPDEETVRRLLPARPGAPLDAPEAASDEAGDGDAFGRVAVERVRTWARWLAAQPFAAAVRDAEPQLEMAFLTRIAGLPVRGVMDLYAPGVPMVLDYKTGHTPRPEAYAVQVSVYVAALRALDLPAPDRAHLVYVDAEQTCEVPAEPVDELVGAFVAAHRGAGVFPPEPGEACRHCEFRPACVRDGVPCP